MRLKIVVPAYNSVAWIPRTLESIASQTYRDYDVCVIDDHSTQEGQREIIGNFCRREGWLGIFREHNHGALANIVHGISALNPKDDDVIILVDGDDWLYNTRVFERIADVYRKEPVSLTYGQYVSYPMGRIGVARPVDPDTIESKDYRRLRWSFSHLRTFKYSLWKEIRDEDLRDENGDYFAVAWDLALMFPMLEMAGHSIKYLHDVLYVYNKANPLNDDKLRRDEQLRVEKLIRSKPPYPRLVHTRCDPDGTTFSARWHSHWLYLRRKLRMPPTFHNPSP